MLVVDASVLTVLVADGGADGDSIRTRMRGEAIAGPDLLRIEVVSALRRHLTIGELRSEHAATAIEDLIDLPITVFPTAPLLRRIWELRENVTPYDATYVALAEVLDTPLLTADRRLANAPGIHCAVEVL